MKIELAADRRARLVAHLRVLFAKEFEEELSSFRAEAIIELMLRTLGPAIYNQAVLDVRGHLQEQLDDLEGEVFVDGDL